MSAKRARADAGEEAFTILDVVRRFRQPAWLSRCVLRTLREAVATTLERDPEALVVTFTLPAEIPPRLVLETLRKVQGVTEPMHLSTGVAENSYSVEVNIAEESAAASAS